MRARFIVALLLATTAAAAAPALALAESLVVPIDHSTRLDVRGSAASVVVVTVVDSHTVFISGRGYGETDVVILDHAGRTLYSGDVIVAAAGSGRVSVYRGSDRTDLACAPACSVSTRSPVDPSKEGAASAGAGASPVAGFAQGVGGMAAGGVNAAAKGAATVAQPG
jgi:hypothetical protein